MRDTYYDWDETIYYEYGSDTAYIAGIGIDDNTYGNSMTDIYNGIDWQRMMTGSSFSIAMNRLPAIPVNTRHPMPGWKIS